MKNNLLKITQHYGVNNQQRKFVEECYELLEAIIQKEYPAIAKGHKNEQLDILENKHIAEEIADIMVMLKQFQYYYEIEDKQIEDIMKYKIKRQLERIDKEC